MTTRVSGALFARACFCVTFAFAGFVLVSPASTAQAAGQGHVVEGLVTTTSTGEPLADAEVTLVELSRTVRTGAEGVFSFRDVPAGTFTIGVHRHGFSSFHARLTVPRNERLRIILEPSRFEEEITVTATPFSARRLEVPQQVDVVAGDEARRESTASLGRALESVPGVSNIPTGEGLGTPVVRGLSENRVRILNDGFPLNHQQFSWRHSPNVEASLADRVEVVRGPASVLYGPDAMGGVVNVIQPALPVAGDGRASLQGEVAAGWGSNADERTGRAYLEGAVGSIGWNAGLIRRHAGDFETPEGTLDNTDFEQTNGNIAVGVTGEWGTARLRWSHWELDTGFHRPRDFRLSLDDDLIAGEVYLPHEIGDFEISLGRQTNIRKAFPAPLEGAAAVDLKLDTTAARVALHHRAVAGWRGRLAVEWTGVDNRARALGALLPEYATDGYAVMLYEESRWLHGPTGETDRFILSLGARWDGSDLSVPADVGRDLPNGFDADYGAVTGSLGLVYRATKAVSVAANVGRGWRPPSAFQLFANGVHGGVSAVQIGDRGLEEESNLNTEISVRVATPTVRAYVTAFRSDFDDFIYLADTGDVQGDLPVFQYQQADAKIDGIEASLEASLGGCAALSVTYAAIESTNEEAGRPLPQEPADRWTVSAECGRDRLGRFRDPYIALDVALVGNQQVSGPDEPFGVATDAYEVVDLRAGLSWAPRDVVWGVDLTIRNLLDSTYTDFLYSYKAFAPNPGRDVRLVARARF